MTKDGGQYRRRFFLQKPGGELVRFASLHQIKDDQIHVYPHGFKTKKPTIVQRWQDQTGLSSSDLRATRFRWAYAQDPKAAGQLAYVSWHPTKLYFRLQLSERGRLTNSIDVKAEGTVHDYIEGRLISDLGAQYKLTGKPREHDVVIHLGPHDFATLRYVVAVEGFDLRNHPVYGGVAEAIFKLQEPEPFIVFPDVTTLTSDAAAARPEGTILSFLFNEGHAGHSLKALLVK